MHIIMHVGAYTCTCTVHTCTCASLHLLYTYMYMYMYTKSDGHKSTCRCMLLATEHKNVSSLSDSFNTLLIEFKIFMAWSVGLHVHVHVLICLCSGIVHVLSMQGSI